jgi:RNA-binding protein NOB1
VNGKPPGKAEDGADDTKATETGESTDVETSIITSETTKGQDDATPDVAKDVTPSDETTSEVVTEQLQRLDVNAAATEDGIPEDAEESSEDDDGDGEWITPSNIKKYQARENAHTAPQTVQRVLQAALITGDMAMRNVALRINLK